MSMILRRLLPALGLAAIAAIAMMTAVPLAAAPSPDPARLVAVALSPTAAKLTWTDRGAVGVTEYRVELKAIDGEFADIGGVPAGGVPPVAFVQGLQPASAYAFRVRASRSGLLSGYSNEAAVVTSAVPEPCVADAQTLCLGARFRVQATWTARDGRAGRASVQPVPSGDSGLLWFVASDNLELLVKALYGCAENGRRWIFVGPATNFQYVLTVADTRTGKVRVYFNPQGVSPRAVTDTEAFDDCP
jgi:hypothetical protein